MLLETANKLHWSDRGIWRGCSNANNHSIGKKDSSNDRCWMGGIQVRSRTCVHGSIEASSHTKDIPFMCYFSMLISG